MFTVNTIQTLFYFRADKAGRADGRNRNCRNKRGSVVSGQKGWGRILSGACPLRALWLFVFSINYLRKKKDWRGGVRVRGAPFMPAQ